MSLRKLRNRHFFILDILIFGLSPYLSLVLRLDTGRVPDSFVLGLAVYTVVSLIVRLTVFYWFGVYRRFWQYASIDELLLLGVSAVMGMAVITPLFFLWRVSPMLNLARSVLAIDGLLTFLATAGIRFSVRLSETRGLRRPKVESHRVLVVGAGDAGTMIVRELQRNPDRGLIPVAFVDDDVDKQQMQIRGIPVIGGHNKLSHVVPTLRVDQVIIAMPTAPGTVIREIVEICERLQVETKVVPSMSELLDGTVNISQLRNVDIEDLLRRAPVQTDIEAVRASIAGRRILITGAGGSIGGELCRQVMRCRPAQLVVLGHGENSVFEIYHELRRLNSTEIELIPLIADTRFEDRIGQIFEEYRPHIVFHAAAHKHVPMMELNPAEAITNNVLGTRTVMNAAATMGVERFVLISTDKAVNPTSVMGASKRTAELLVLQAAKKSGKPFVAVRFGNVLGSRGSVVLTFKQQIAAGGPVTVTDPEMTRYFMTVPEAVQLVLQAAVLGEGGELFVLDMGEPVKILDLARDLIELSGLEVGRDIEIQFTGVRPGEKLYEELFVTGEEYHRTRHEKVFIAVNSSSFVPVALDDAVNALEAAARRNDEIGIFKELKSLLPEFRPIRQRTVSEGQMSENGPAQPWTPHPQWSMGEAADSGG